MTCQPCAVGRVPCRGQSRSARNGRDPSSRRSLPCRRPGRGGCDCVRSGNCTARCHKARPASSRRRCRSTCATTAGRSAGCAPPCAQGCRQRPSSAHRNRPTPDCT
eukprot:scaffold58522_cov32-Tisochrysis_lutea.AAC.2